MIKVNDFSRPKKFEDMMELNLELTEKLVKKEKFKSGYAIISFFKSVIEFNEGTKNSHLYYEKVVDDDKKVKLKKLIALPKICKYLPFFLVKYFYLSSNFTSLYFFPLNLSQDFLNCFFTSSFGIFFTSSKHFFNLSSFINILHFLL